MVFSILLLLLFVDIDMELSLSTRVVLLVWSGDETLNADFLRTVQCVKSIRIRSYSGPYVRKYACASYVPASLFYEIFSLFLWSHKYNEKNLFRQEFRSRSTQYPRNEKIQSFFLSSGLSVTLLQNEQRCINSVLFHSKFVCWSLILYQQVFLVFLYCRTFVCTS